MSEAVKGDPAVDLEVIEFTDGVHGFIEENDEMWAALCDYHVCKGLSLETLRNVKHESEHLMGLIVSILAEVNKHISIKHEQSLGGEKSARLALEQRITELEEIA